MYRWGRMKQIFSLLNESPLTVGELTDILSEDNDDIYLRLIDALLSHYLKYHYVKRLKNPLKHNRYVYTLTKKGKKELDWLNSGEYLEYIKDYEQRYNINE